MSENLRIFLQKWPKMRVLEKNTLRRVADFDRKAVEKTMNEFVGIVR